MIKISKIMTGVLILIVGVIGMIMTAKATTGRLLTEPMLQLPKENSVMVVWFTDFNAKDNVVLYGKDLENSTQAKTIKLSRVRTFDSKKVNVWRHEAVVENLPTYHGNKDEKVPYCIESDGVRSTQYLLQAKPAKGTPMQILLTSDGQLKEMVAANLQILKKTVGQIDAVFYAGDLVNIPDQADEWFNFNNETSFFSLMQGKAHKEINGVSYCGAPILQQAPMYTAVGNHEFMGQYSDAYDLGLQFNDVKVGDYNTISYEEIFSMPKNQKNSELYYAETIGDVRLVVLNVARMWRNNVVGEKSNYSEDVRSLANPLMTSGGAIIYEPIKRGSTQYQWLEQELHSVAFQEAKYKVVMFHHQVHGMGLNVVPAFTDPVKKEIKDDNGNVMQILYEYPLEDDYLVKDLEPLLDDAGVELVFNGHSHVWNRFQTQGEMNYLESSNVGNSYGAFYQDKGRAEIIPNDMTYFDAKDFALSGDPSGLKPIAPLFMDRRMPYITSNTITVFSVLNTKTGLVSSYAYDTEKPEKGAYKIDYFKLGEKIK